MDKQQDRGSTRQRRYSGVHPTQQQPNHHELERLNLDDRRTPAPSTPPSTASSHGNASDENQPDGGFHLLVGNNEQHLRTHGYFGDHDARILLRFNSSHIPGKPGRRHIVLITTFFAEKVGRRYSDDDDYVHLPSAIFEPNAKCWMIIDLSVQRRKTLDNVPIFCYRVRTSNDGASVQFSRVNFTDARHYSNIFPWGRFLGSDTSDDSGEDEEERGEQISCSSVN